MSLIATFGRKPTIGIDGLKHSPYTAQPMGAKTWMLPMLTAKPPRY